MPVLAVALDLGTTRIKAGVFHEDGRLRDLVSRPVPPIGGSGLIRESSAADYLRAAREVLGRVAAGLPRGTPLGIASQRSSFTLWERRTGDPVTPLISWQDRRAASWCDRHRSGEPRVSELTGLVLSPHYAGPKLAALLDENGKTENRGGHPQSVSTPLPGPAELRHALEDGRLLFGNLDAFLLWTLTEGRCHQTDITMAGRTLLADSLSGSWSAEMLDFFGVPASALPEIASTLGRSIALEQGPRLAASVADQPSGTLPVLGEREDSALVNLGTGGFVMRSTGSTMLQPQGYLSGPTLGRSAGDILYALEGSINGAAVAVDRFGSGPTTLPVEDPSADAFCLPDVTGIGSPYWLPDRTLTLSPAAEALPESDQRRVVLEGLLFRVREILEGLFTAAAPALVYLAGGLSREPFIAPGLAACLGHSIELLDEPEGTLLGAARLAAGLPIPAAGLRSRTVRPAEPGSYLHGKFDRWTVWLRELLAS